jgi:hypothetical protein
MVEIKIKGIEVNRKGETVECFHPAGFKFTKYTFEQLSLMKGLNTQDSLGTACIYCAYKTWCYIRQIDEKLTFEDIINWIESGAEQSTVDQLTDEFLASDFWKRIEEATKKNANLNAA